MLIVFLYQKCLFREGEPCFPELTVGLELSCSSLTIVQLATQILGEFIPEYIYPFASFINTDCPPTLALKLCFLHHQVKLTAISILFGLKMFIMSWISFKTSLLAPTSGYRVGCQSNRTVITRWPRDDNGDWQGEDTALPNGQWKWTETCVNVQKWHTLRQGVGLVGWVVRETHTVQARLMTGHGVWGNGIQYQSMSMCKTKMVTSWTTPPPFPHSNITNHKGGWTTVQGNYMVSPKKECLIFLSPKRSSIYVHTLAIELGAQHMSSFYCWNINVYS